MQLSGNLGVRVAGGPGSLEGRLGLIGEAGPLAGLVLESAADTSLTVTGHLDLDAAVSGSIDDPAVHVDLGMTDLAVDDVKVPRLVLSAALCRDSVRVDTVALETLGGEIGGRGSARMDSLIGFESSFEIRRIEVGRLLELVRQDTLFPEGFVEGTLVASGDVRRPLMIEAAADFSVSRLQYRGKPIPPISLAVSSREGEGRLTLSQGVSQVKAQAALRRDRLDGTFSVHIPELAPLASLFVPDLSGFAEVEGRLAGSPESPVVYAEIDSVQLVYRHFPLDDLHGSLSYSGGRITLEGIRFRGGLAEIDSLNPPLGLVGLKGGFEYEGFVEGPADRPEGWVRAGASTLGYKTLTVDTLTAAVRLDGDEVLIEDIAFVRDSLLVHASGLYSLTGSSGSLAFIFRDFIGSRRDVIKSPETALDVGEETPEEPASVGSIDIDFRVSGRESLQARAVGSGIDLELFTGLLEGSPVCGELAFWVDVSGNRTRPDVDMEFTVLRPGFEAIGLDSISGRIVLGGDELRVESLDAYRGAARNRLTAVLALGEGAGGGYAVTEQSAFKGSAHTERLDLGLVNPILPDGIEVEGDLSYDLTWDGTIRAPRPHGRLAMSDAAVMTGGEGKAVESIRMDVFFADSVISVDKLTGVVKDTPFELGATVATSDWRDFGLELDLSLAAYGAVTGRGRLSREAVDFEAVADRVNLDVLSGLSPSIERVEGDLNAKISVEGSPAAPRIRGGLRLRNLTVESPEFSPPLVGGVVVVDFEGNTVLVDSVFARMGKGHVLVSGRLTHEQGKLVETGFVVEIDDLGFERPGIAKVNIASGDLSYSGTEEKHVLDGDVVMGDTRFVMNFDPRSILPFAGSVRKPRQEMPPALANTFLDVRLRDSKDLWVDNNVARVRSHAELNVLGSLSQPNVTGRVTVEEGYVMFLDRKFEIVMGTVDFIERDRLNPIIEIKTRSDVKTYRALRTETYEVRLDIMGPLDQVKVSLTSEPALDRANILSLLTLGVTREELAGSGMEGEGPGAGEALKARAEELTTRVVSGFVSRNVADMFGLKELSIEGNLFRRDAGGGARLLASRGLSDRVDVTYSTNIGDFNENRVRMDYRLSDRFLLQGETDQEGKAAIDLKFRVRFR
jgi:autotransporter translocation and assembly factor TamB